MVEVKVDLRDRSYKITAAPGIAKKTGEYMSALNLGKKVLLVTNPRVLELYGEMVKTSLQNAGFELTVAVVPDGEEYKNLREAEKLYEAAFAAGLERDCPVVALGGGVIGDLAGFVASTYMRGVPLVQMPTTLLAQVDSSVGGKVAVNHPRGKNIIGSFYQPRAVIADLEFLKSLPARELRAGLAEVIKCGIIRDTSFFEWLEKNTGPLLEADSGALAVAVERSCRVKAEVVEADETEQGMRAVLNFGHTVGHALESITGYRVYRHGEAISIGMVAASRLAEKLGLAGKTAVERIEALLVQAGLPTEIPGEITGQELIAAFYRDKKAYAGKITFVFPREIGRVEIKRDVAEEDLDKLWA